MSLVLICNYTILYINKKSRTGVSDGHNVEVDAHIDL